MREKFIPKSKTQEKGRKNIEEFNKQLVKAEKLNAERLKNIKDFFYKERNIIDSFAKKRPEIAKGNAGLIKDSIKGFSEKILKKRDKGVISPFKGLKYDEKDKKPEDTEYKSIDNIYIEEKVESFIEKIEKKKKLILSTLFSALFISVGYLALEYILYKREVKRNYSGKEVEEFKKEGLESSRKKEEVLKKYNVDDEKKELSKIKEKQENIASEEINDDLEQMSNLISEKDEKELKDLADKGFETVNELNKAIDNLYKPVDFTNNKSETVKDINVDADKDKEENPPTVVEEKSDSIDDLNLQHTEISKQMSNKIEPYDINEKEQKEVKKVEVSEVNNSNTFEKIGDDYIDARFGDIKKELEKIDNIPNVKRLSENLSFNQCSDIFYRTSLSMENMQGLLNGLKNNIEKNNITKESSAIIFENLNLLKTELNKDRDNINKIFEDTKNITATEKEKDIAENLNRAFNIKIKKALKSIKGLEIILK